MKRSRRAAGRVPSPHGADQKPPREIPLTNASKPFFPEAGVTKGEVVGYYREVAEFILPHLRNRPVTLIRFPDGVTGKSFYAKNAPRFTPAWVPTYPVERHGSGGLIHYILINNPATLVWCANLAAIELHPFLHRVPDLARPTSLAFDLDPGEGADLLTCIEVGFLIKGLLDRLGLQSFPKVTGSKGLQIYVPLNTRTGYDSTGPFARTVAQLLEQEHPDLVVSRMSKALRRGRVMIDWSQNNAAKTTVCVYSLRARGETPFVSMPLDWPELARAGRRGDREGLYFAPDAARSRLRRRGDLFAPVLKLKQHLPSGFRAGDRPVRVASGPVLKEYEAKRDFRRTGEPRPGSGPAPGSVKGTAGEPRFVVQKHAASNLHYDFRLQMDGALKSWAVPKGLPYALRAKRSGFQTEDHPLEYLTFEGTIPKGQYGGGTVMVWDVGTYELLSGSVPAGSLRVQLRGRKLKGEWRLYRIRKEREKSVWLIEKVGKAMRPVGARREDQSALCRRSMKRIAEDNDAQWHGPRD